MSETINEAVEVEMLPVMSDIPLPKRARAGMALRPRKYPFERMMVGQMFFIAGKTRNTLSTYFANVGKRLTMKFSSRMVHMRKGDDGVWTLCEASDDGAVRGLGVWRTE